VALVALINAQGLSINLSTVKVLGLELVLYRPDSLSFVFGLAFIIASAIVGVYSLHRRDPLQDSTAMIYAGSAVTATDGCSRKPGSRALSRVSPSRRASASNGETSTVGIRRAERMSARTSAIWPSPTRAIRSDRSLLTSEG
jgi:hypothetical protein